MRKCIARGVLFGALIWSGVASAVVRDAEVSVNNAGAPIASATISIKPSAQTAPRPVTTASRPARVAPPQATSRSDNRGIYTFRYDDELHRGAFFDVTVTAGGRSRTLRGLSVDQILAGIDVAAPTGPRSATAVSPGFPAQPGSPVGSPTVEISASGGGNFVTLPGRNLIFRELQGSGVQEGNQIRPSTSSSGPGAQFKVTIDDAPVPASRIYFAFNYFEGVASNGGVYDPGANFRINFPGPTGGASGISIGGNPLNRVTSFLYENRTENFGGGAGIRLPFMSTLGTGASFDAVIGASGNRLTSRELFGGQIPGFARDFLYTTNVDVSSAQLDLGLGVAQILRPQGPSFVVLFQGDVIVSPTFLSANGTDRFDFTGFAPSLVDLDKSKFDVGVGVNGSLSFGLPGASAIGNRISGPSIFVKGAYESRPGFPVVVRDGANPSRLELQRADIFTVSGGLSVPLRTTER